MSTNLHLLQWIKSWSFKVQCSKQVSYWLSRLCDLLYLGLFVIPSKPVRKPHKESQNPLKSLYTSQDSQISWGYQRFKNSWGFLGFLKFLKVHRIRTGYNIYKSTRSTIFLTLLGATTQLLFLTKMGGAAGAVQYISSLAQIGTDKRESWSNVFGIDHVPKNQWCEFHKSITP